MVADENSDTGMPVDFSGVDRADQQHHSQSKYIPNWYTESACLKGDCNTPQQESSIIHTILKKGKK